MAKKDKKGKKDKPQSDGSDVVERVRSAVERTFQATSGSAGPARDVGRSLLDEVANTAQRIRESFDDLRVLEDIRGLRSEIQALSRRVEALENQQKVAAAPTPTAAPAAAKTPTAARTPTGAPSAPAARKPRATTPKPRATTAKPRATAAKPATSERKPRSTAAKSRTPATRRSPAAKPPAAEPPAAGS